MKSHGARTQRLKVAWVGDAGKRRGAAAKRRGKSQAEVWSIHDCYASSSIFFMPSATITAIVHSSSRQLRNADRTTRHETDCSAFSCTCTVRHRVRRVHRGALTDPEPPGAAPSPRSRRQRKGPPESLPAGLFVTRRIGEGLSPPPTPLRDRRAGSRRWRRAPRWDHSPR